jgi:hypothetical protein
MTNTDQKLRNREYQRRYTSKPGVKEKRAKLNRDWIAANRDAYNQAKVLYRFKLKVSALMHYSNGSMACASCGFSSNIDALCLDHINDDGAAHRKTLGCSSRGTAGGTTIYERLKKMGWMEGLQVLCANCNTIKELERKRDGRHSSVMLEMSKRPTRWARVE